MDIAAIGPRIRRLRTLRNMTQEQLAHFALKTDRWLRNVESGRTVPDLDSIQRLANSLRVPIPVVTAQEPIPDAVHRGHGSEPMSADSSSAVHGQLTIMGSDPALTNMEAFRIADRQIGGGHLYAAVVSYLKADLGPRLLTGTPGYFTAAASLTEMAGWMAHDAGHHDAAGEHFQQASRLAQAGDADELSADVAAARAHLALHLEEPVHALEIAQRGQQHLARSARHPGLKSRLYVMEASAAAILGRKTEAVRLLHRAEAALAERPGDASPWVSPYDEASLAGESARCLQALGDLPSAQKAALRVITLRPGDRARSRAFAQLSLALIAMTRPRPDVIEACVIGMEIIKATGALASARVVQQLHDLRRLLLPHRAIQEVGDFLDHLEATVPQKKTVYPLLIHGV